MHLLCLVVHPYSTHKLERWGKKTLDKYSKTRRKKENRIGRLKKRVQVNESLFSAPMDSNDRPTLSIRSAPDGVVCKQRAAVERTGNLNHAKQDA